MRGAGAKRGGVESGQVLLFRKLLEDHSGGSINVGVMGKKVAALANVDGSQLSSPFVQVAEQVAVNGLQMGEVKPALNRRLRKFVRTGRHQGRFSLFERGRVGDAKAIL
jgi:hypothetical protein